MPLFLLHGLNAVYLKNIGRYRIDASGNKEGEEAKRTPPEECLVFPIDTVGEADFLKYGQGFSLV